MYPILGTPGFLPLGLMCCVDISAFLIQLNPLKARSEFMSFAFTFYENLLNLSLIYPSPRVNVNPKCLLYIIKLYVIILCVDVEHKICN